MSAPSQCDQAHPDLRATIPLDGPVIGGGWWIRMEYHSSGGASVRIRAGEQRHDIDLPAGLHSVYFTASGSFTTVEVLRDAGTDVCVSDLVLGLPEAAGS
jgi:hypothetical protein